MADTKDIVTPSVEAKVVMIAGMRRMSMRLMELIINISLIWRNLGITGAFMVLAVVIELPREMLGPAMMVVEGACNAGALVALMVTEYSSERLGVEHHSTVGCKDEVCERRIHEMNMLLSKISLFHTLGT